MNVINIKMAKSRPDFMYFAETIVSKIHTNRNIKDQMLCIAILHQIIINPRFD